MIVAVIGEKGGTGKTTLAAHLAGWRCMSGRDVMLVDADRQGSASMWVSIRQELGLRSPRACSSSDAACAGRSATFRAGTTTW